MNFKQKNSFTLLEIVLAVMIFGVIAGIISSILFTVQQSWIKIQKSTTTLESRIKTDLIADLVLRNAVPFFWKDHDGKEKSVFYGDKEELFLAYRHRINSPEEQGIRFVKLYLKDGALMVAYRAHPVLYWEMEEIPDSLSEEIILSGVRKVTFSYADKTEDQIVWSETWDENSMDIPLAINLKIEFADGSVLQYLRRTAGVSFYSTWGKRNENKTVEKSS